MSHSITKELRKKDFTVKESPNKIDAKSSDNIANKNESNSGVQLELNFINYIWKDLMRGNQKKKLIILKIL